MSKFRDMFLLLFVTVLLAVVGADQDMAMDKSRVKIVSDSGEIQFQRQLGDASTLTDPVKIKMAQVVQVDAAGTEVATCSKLPSAPQIPMKKFNGFAGKAFNIEGMRNAQALPNAGSMKASMTKFAADLGADVGKMSIDLALAEEAGEVSIAGEKQALKKGDMKFNMELSEWNWCGTAGQSGAAAFLDVYIEVTSKQQPTMDSDRNATAPASFQLGDGMKMSFSGKVRDNNNNPFITIELSYICYATRPWCFCPRKPISRGLSYQSPEGVETLYFLFFIIQPSITLSHSINKKFFQFTTLCVFCTIVPRYAQLFATLCVFSSIVLSYVNCPLNTCNNVASRNQQ